jgi:D-serine deaminase-like pyridoxal phosphate-dependent protein
MLKGITRPSLIVKEDVCRNNIRRMAEKADASSVIFRPHFKTHQSLEVSRWFREYGVDKITVSSAEMALQFAGDVWCDITIAFPANIRELQHYNELKDKIQLNLLVDSTEASTALSQGIKAETGIFIEVDCGYGRSGIQYDNLKSFDAVIRIIKASARLKFKGFLLHSGDTYQANSLAEISRIYQRNILQLKSLKDRYIEKFPDIIISMGDTPSCSILDDLSEADEIRPGNFVYYDLMQYSHGVCELSDIAVSVACPVAGVYPERNEVLIYGGAIHLSKEFLDQEGRNYGLIVQYTDEGWSDPVPNTRLVSISQEHGIIRTNIDFLKTLKHGDIVGIIPVHSCLTANLLKDNMLII